MSSQNSTPKDSLLERNREKGFVISLVVGMLVFALGMAFFILSLSMNAHPPAPYFASVTDRILTGVISVGFMIAGILIIRLGSRIGGW